MVTDPQTHPQTHTQTHRQDRLQYIAPQLASVQCRDVPDIRFRFLLAGYPAVFFYPVPVPVPAEMVPGTGYLYRIVKLFEMDGTL